MSMNKKALQAALDYIPQWIDYQMRQSDIPGCVIAIAHDSRIVFEAAFGLADVKRKIPLRTSHHFRVASHSKSFTAAGILRLREMKKLKLDDEAGDFVKGLHPALARATVAQLLSHSAGVIRDGKDAGQWTSQREFLSREELLAALAEPQPIEANTRFKYSNHGYGLLGLIIEAVSGHGYNEYIARNVIAPAGLTQTFADMPARGKINLAHGYGTRILLGTRYATLGETPTHAMAPATGFVSTARDLALFFAQLSPHAAKSFLSAASRRDMVRQLWTNPHSAIEGHYGLGLMSAAVGNWHWFGHGGSFPGFITRTTVLPKQGLSISVLTNASDGLAAPWGDGVIRILKLFADRGAPPAKWRDWRGRWWSTMGAVDLLPVRDRVIVATPGFFNPLMDAGEIAVRRKDRGNIVLANGYANHGEQAALLRRADGKVKALQLAGFQLLPEAAMARQVQKTFGATRRRKP